MSSINILNYKDIDVNEIKFSSPEKVKGGSYISIPKYNGELIYIQTPRLINKGFTKTEQRCSIELELDNTHLNFYEFITNIDDFNIVEIQKNSKEWFKQEFPLDVVEEFYKSPVKMARSKKAPSLKIKIPLSKGSIDCGIYNNNNQLINYSQIKEDAKVLTVLQFYGLRFLKQQVICEWVPMQIKVFDETVVPQNNYMIDDSLLSDNEDNSDDVINTLNEIQSNIERIPNKNESNESLDSESNNEENIDTVSDIDQVNPDEILKNELNLNSVDIFDTQANEASEPNESTQPNESNESTQPNESNESNESKQSNESNESTQPNESNEDSGVTEENKVTEENLGNLENSVSEEKDTISSLQNVIIEKNDRIELLENKIRELYKYLSNN